MLARSLLSVFMIPSLALLASCEVDSSLEESSLRKAKVKPIPTCPPEYVEIVVVDGFAEGTDADECFIGSGEDDLIIAGGGDDLIFGVGGNDILLGGLGNDTIFGGKGDDLLDGEEGSDELDGEQGADTLIGGPGDDFLTDRDNKIGDVLHGNGGDDVVASTSTHNKGDPDVAYGGDGYDLCTTPSVDCEVEASDAPTKCSTDAECDDADPCNGVETCTGEGGQKGICELGTPVVSELFLDADGDGFGGPTSVLVCPFDEIPPGLVDNSLDCADDDPGVYPDATEECNDIDDNCDGVVDEDACSGCAIGPLTLDQNDAAWSVAVGGLNSLAAFRGGLVLASSNSASVLIDANTGSVVNPAFPTAGAGRSIYIDPFDPLGDQYAWSQYSGQLVVPPDGIPIYTDPGGCCDVTQWGVAIDPFVTPPTGANWGGVFDLDDEDSVTPYLPLGLGAGAIAIADANATYHSSGSLARIASSPGSASVEWQVTPAAGVTLGLPAIASTGAAIVAATGTHRETLMTPGNLFAYAADTLPGGGPSWEVAADVMSLPVVASSASGELVIVGREPLGGPTITAYHTSSGLPSWEREASGRPTWLQIGNDGVIYYSTRAGSDGTFMPRIVGLCAATGEDVVVFEGATGGLQKLLVGGYLVVTGDGFVTGYDLAALGLATSLDPDSPWPSPAHDNQRTYNRFSPVDY